MVVVISVGFEACLCATSRRSDRKIKTHPIRSTTKVQAKLLPGLFPILSIVR